MHSTFRRSLWTEEKPMVSPLSIQDNITQQTKMMKYLRATRGTQPVIPVFERFTTVLVSYHQVL